MSLNEYEQSVFKAYTSEFSPDDLLHVREAALAEAPHVSFHEIEGIFEGPLRLEFESGYELVIKAWPWTDETRPEPNASVLGRIDASYGFSSDIVAPRNGIIIDGASLDGVMREEDKGTIARMCDLAYRTCTSKKVTYTGLSKEAALEKLHRIEALRAIGMVRRSGNNDYMLEPSSIVRYLPPVLQVYAGIENRPLFDN